MTRNNRGFVTALTDNLKVGTTLTTLASYGVGYSPKLTLGQITASLPACAAQSGTTTYDYDTKFQLTSETSTRWSGYSQTHAYDNAGNPTTLRSLPASGSYTYNADNQRTTGAGTTYAYDGNGNPTTYKGSTLIYDAENRLASVGSNFSSSYRPDGLRASKTASGYSSSVSNNTTNYFLYDGLVPFIELDSSGNVYSVSSFGANGYLSRHISTYAYSWFHFFDANGQEAVFVRGDTGGSFDAYAVFDGFGARDTSYSYVASDPFFGYGSQAGYYTDWETGLTLCGHRFYDSGTGRWLTRDPIGMAGGINLYSYCGNNVTGADDPSGHAQIVTNEIFGRHWLPYHRYIRFGRPGGCAGSNTWGFFADTTFGTGLLPGEGTIKGDNNPDGSPNTSHDPTQNNSGTRGGPHSVTNWNGNPDFGDRLCKCILESKKNPPIYYLFGYNCQNWAGDMWECAEGIEPTAPPVGYKSETPMPDMIPR